jgi:phosphoribosylformylglycinamidine synthase subunit PurSL
VESISDFSVELGIPFISGKDSSSGTFDAAGKAIDVPFTLAVAALGRLPDVRRVTTKEFKQPGNKIFMAGYADSTALGGSVYADCRGQRGNRLFDAYTAPSIRALWDALFKLHGRGAYVSGSAIAEGGITLRLFEAAYGSGFGVRLALPAQLAEGARRDAFLFGEFIGSVLLEVSAEFDPAPAFGLVPCRAIGEVIRDPRIVLTDGDAILWQDEVSNLARIWSRPFRELLQ